MANRISVYHQTRYEYDRPVFLSPHLFRLKPAAHSRTPIEHYSLTVRPAEHMLHWQQDPFGNFVARVDFQEPMQELLVEVEFIANLIPINPFDFLLDAHAAYFPFEYEPQQRKDLSPYLEISEQGPQMRRWLNELDRSKQGIMDFIVRLNQLVHQHVSYTVRLQPGVQSSEESLELALGSCRDSAWLLVQAMRHLGLAARFVSGYLVQLAGDNSASGETTEVETDVMAFHAWAEVFIPGAGWIGLDATSGLLAGEGHIPLACTAVPASASPVTGTTESCQASFTYSSGVTRLE